MKEIEQVKNALERLKRNSQELNSNVSSLKKEEEISTNFHILCLKKLSLQALDLLNAMEKQVKLYEYKKSSLERLKRKKER
jgi:hypothetical protein